MDPRNALVDSRIDDLRRLSDELHVERRASDARSPRRGSLRHALGLRLVAFGAMLLGDLDTGAPVGARR